MFDNKYVMDFDGALNLIKSFFDKQIAKAILIKEYNESAGYWGIKYKYDDLIISIECDRGGLETIIIKGSKEIPLKQFDDQIESAEVASEKNIRFTLDVIKRFLEIVK